MLAGAAHTYLNRYGVRVGARAVIVTCQRRGLPGRARSEGRGRAISPPSRICAGASPAPCPTRRARAGIDVLPASTVLGTRGDLRVSGVTLGRVDGAPGATPGGAFACDALLDVRRLHPERALVLSVARQARVERCPQGFRAGMLRRGERSAGACRGVYGSSRSVGGRRAGRGRGGCRARTARSAASPSGAAAERRGLSRRSTAAGLRRAAKSLRRLAARCDRADLEARHARRLSIDRTRQALHHHRHGDRSGQDLEPQCHGHRRRRTRHGDAAGGTRPRSACPTRRSPSAASPVSRAATCSIRCARRPPTRGRRPEGRCSRMSGLWKRARYFPRAGEDMHAAVARECRAVRSGCGIFDASTLGKIEVVGPDAAEFMNRLYVNNWTNLGVGRSRYGILLREDGFVFDDGVVARLDADRFHVTTTTGGAPRVLAMMEDYRQTEWPDLKVWLTSTTEQWAVIAVQGPQCARRCSRPLIEGLDISAAACPHMSVARGRICGVPMLLFRVSFTGELGFEINVPADFGLRRLGGGACRGPGAWHHRVRHRDDACAARGKRLHHRRPGHRRHGHARRCGTRLGHRQEQGGLRRQALAAAGVDECGNAQAAGRPAHARTRAGARGRRASCRTSPGRSRPWH